MKITAVSWLVEKLYSKDVPFYYKDIIELAKQMERLQLIDAQSYAISNADMTNNRGYFDCDKWYDETYGSKGSDEQRIYGEHTITILEISDEEIEDAGETFHWDFRGATEFELSAFIFGAKWYREQLKKK